MVVSKLVLAVGLGFSQRPRFFLTWASLWGCLLGLPHSMTTRNECFKRQEVDTANTLRPGPRNCHGITSVIFSWSNNDKVCSDTSGGDVGLIMM